MAEITKLSVGKALDKLRGTDVPNSKMTQVDEKIDLLDKETQRLRAMRYRLERDQRTRSIAGDTPEARPKGITKLSVLGIMVGIVVIVLIPLLVWWGLQ